MRCSWSSCTVFASGRPVTTSSCERPRSRIIPRNRLICGELEISSQMFMTPHRLVVRVPGEVDFRVPSQELLQAVDRIRGQGFGMPHALYPSLHPVVGEACVAHVTRLCLDQRKSDVSANSCSLRSLRPLRCSFNKLSTPALLNHVQAGASGSSNMSATRSLQKVLVHVPNGARKPFLRRLTMAGARCRVAASLWAILPPRRETRYSTGRDSTNFTSSMSS